MVSVLCALATCLHVYMYGGHGTVHCSTDGGVLYVIMVYCCMHSQCMKLGQKSVSEDKMSEHYQFCSAIQKLFYHEIIVK